MTYVIDKYLSELPTDASLLDYGCGTMPYKELYAKHIHNYFGADISINPERSFNLDVETSKISVNDNNFDVLISTQVLEHVVSPSDYLKEAYRVTKAGGLFIISTHGFYPYHPDPNDYWRWTASGLNKILNDNGWQPLETLGIIGYTATAISLFQYSIAPRLPQLLKVPFEIIMQRLIWLVDSLFSKESRKENSVIYLIIAKSRK